MKKNEIEMYSCPKTSHLYCDETYEYRLDMWKSKQFSKMETNNVRSLSHDNEVSISGLCSLSFPKPLDRNTANSFKSIISAMDLHKSPPSSESSVVIESMSRTIKYSPQEKKERIERYRRKRAHRNFNRKIKYECRKTLADSRPRIKGRFARVDNKDPMISQLPYMRIDEEREEDDTTWVNDFLEAFSDNSLE